MGRASRKRERREQILAGFERCVAEHGLAGTTLERVAVCAEVGRPSIRHNVGNRDDLMGAALERIVERHRAGVESFVDDLPRLGRLDALLAYLFVGPFAGPADDEEALLDELFALRHRDERVATALADAYRALEQAIAVELRRTAPSASPAATGVLAHAIMSLAYGHSTFDGLGVAARRRGRDLLRLARRWIDELETRPTLTAS